MTQAPALPLPSSRRIDRAPLDRRQRTLGLERTPGFLLVDVNSRIVGRVKNIVYAGSPLTPSGLSTRSGFFWRRHRLVPIEAIAARRRDASDRSSSLSSGARAHSGRLSWVSISLKSSRPRRMTPREPLRSAQPTLRSSGSSWQPPPSAGCSVLRPHSSSTTERAGCGNTARPSSLDSGATPSLLERLRLEVHSESWTRRLSQDRATPVRETGRPGVSPPQS
jgi:hypothetical protein